MLNRLLNLPMSALLVGFLWLVAAPAVSGPNAVVSLGEIAMSGRGGAVSHSGGAAADAGRSVLFFPSASDPLRRQGFVRVVNRLNRGGSVSITAFDDAGRRHGPVTLTLDAQQTVHLNSGDLEDGNAGKRLLSGVGRPSQGDWRLELAGDLDIKVLSYIRTSDGFVTAMHDVVPSDAGVHRVAFFNPGSNWRQESLLRVVNPGDSAASVAIRGVDDRGVDGGIVRLSVPPRAAGTFTAAELEGGAPGLTGSLGDGTGKWRLEVEADVPIHVMSLLATPTGHLTNLSTDPGAVGTAMDDPPPAPTVTLAGRRSVEVSYPLTEPEEGDYAVEIGVRRGRTGVWEENCRYATHSGGPARYTREFNYDQDIPVGTVVQARYRYQKGRSCTSGTPGPWSLIGEATVSSSGPSDRPDLVVESPSVSDAAPAAGGAFTLQATVRNRGDGQSDSTTLRYYRSSNSTISASDSEVGTDPVGRLAAAATSAESISLTAPSNAGTYYYGACVDSVSGESSSANNCSNGVRVEVASGGGGSTDTYCRADDRIAPGGECNLYNTSFVFDVSSSGRGCLRAGGILNCSSNRIRLRNSTLNGVRITFVANSNSDNSWTLSEVDPSPPG